MRTACNKDVFEAQSFLNPGCRHGSKFLIWQDIKGGHFGIGDMQRFTMTISCFYMVEEFLHLIAMFNKLKLVGYIEKLGEKA